MSTEEKEMLINLLNKIWEHSNVVHEIPLKAMRDYTVDDIVKLRVALEMVRGDVNTIVEVFELREVD